MERKIKKWIERERNIAWLRAYQFVEGCQSSSSISLATNSCLYYSMLMISWLFANNEAELQKILDIICSWCIWWRLNIYEKKEPDSACQKIFQSSITFLYWWFGERNLKLVYKSAYLEVVLDELMNFITLANELADRFSNALGILLANIIAPMAYVSKYLNTITCIAKVSD